MPVAIPETIANDLLTRVQAVADAGRFARANDPELQAILRDAEKLRLNHPGQYYAVLGSIATVMGKKNKAMQALNRADQVGIPDAAWPMRARVRLLGKLLFATEGQAAVFEFGYTSSLHQYTDIVGWDLSAIGAFQEFCRFYEKVQAAQVNLPDDVVRHSEQMLAAAALLRNQGVDDATCAKVLDVAGEVMREHELIWVDTMPQIIVDYDASTVGLHFSVNTTVTEALDMLDEMTDRLIDKGLDTIPLYPLFRGTKVDAKAQDKFQPTAETLRAFAEIERGNLQRFDSVGELFADLHAGN